MSILVTLIALLLEAFFGYPDRLLRAIGHPVTWIGRLIDDLDRLLNREAATDATRRHAGALALFILVCTVGALAYLFEYNLTALPFGYLGVALAASTLIAQRSLHDHVAVVASALEHDGLAGGRDAVSHIVGRDTLSLDEAGVARAAIESLAENFSDGIVAPALWTAIAGLAGGAAYKAINTADSMIGHRSPRHQAFGFYAAKLDDLVNLPASRLSALLIVMAAAITPGASALNAWHAIVRDARHHRSPNAGFPEAAMAGALGLALAGPRVYAGVAVDDAIMGNGRREATPKDIHAALDLYQTADSILIGSMAALALIISVLG
jgi:adenosylcobinamide-phosphate synthase